MKELIDKYKALAAEAEKVKEGHPYSDFTGTFSNLLENLLEDLETLQPKGKTKGEVKQMFFEEHTELQGNGLRKVITMPHDLFEWFWANQQPEAVKEGADKELMEFAVFAAQMEVDSSDVGLEWQMSPYARRIELFRKSRELTPPQK